MDICQINGDAFMKFAQNVSVQLTTFIKYYALYVPIAPV